MIDQDKGLGWTSWIYGSSLVALLAFATGCRQGSKAGSTARAAETRVNWEKPARSVDGRELNGFAAISFALELPNGTLVVGDRRLSELDFFPARDEPFTVAGRGRGPGELEVVQGGGMLPPDSTLVVESTRASLFSSTGAFVRSIRLPEPGQRYEFIGPLGDSLLLMRQAAYNIDVPGLLLDSARYVAISRSTGAARHEFTLPNRYSYVDLSTGRTFWTFPPFIERAVAGVLDQRLVWFMGGRHQMYLMNAQGAVVDSIRVAVPRVPLNADEVAAAEAERIARKPEDAWLRGRWERMFSQVSFPSRKPIDQLIVGSDDFVWVATAVGSPADSTRWWALDTEGRVGASMTVPPGIALTQITSAEVVAIDTDPYDVQRVLLFERR